MDFRQLEFFVALGDTLNYTAAAERCHISRQGLRQAVASIENEYSVDLVANTGNKLSLTPAGQLFLERAKALLSEFRLTEAELRSFSIGHRLIRIGVSTSLIPYYAPEVLSVLNDAQNSFPDMQIEMITENADCLLDKLGDGLLDAAILVDMNCMTEGFHRTIIRTDRFGIVLSKNHFLSAKNALELADLDGQKITVMSAPQRCFRPLVEALEERKIQAEFIIEPDFYESFRKVRGDGILGMDRVEWIPEDNLSLALERDLPISDFPAELQTVFLMRNPPEKELLAFAKYVEESARKERESIGI